MKNKNYGGKVNTQCDSRNLFGSSNFDEFFTQNYYIFIIARNTNDHRTITN